MTQLHVVPRLIPDSDLAIPSRLLGEGTFGQVFVGKLVHDASKSGSKEDQVVMKRVKKQIQGETKLVVPLLISPTLSLC